MPSVSGHVQFECGTRYCSDRIDLCTFDYKTHGSWLFALPVDAQPMAKRGAVGTCRLHLSDGRTGECRCTGYDPSVLRFEGLGELDKAALKPVRQP
ncbi:MAG: hypothetical protein AMXMBFR7_30840 [Planctomycetota bacterium]